MRIYWIFFVTLCPSIALHRIDREYFKNSMIDIFFKDSEENMLAGVFIHSGPDYKTFLSVNSSQFPRLFFINVICAHQR